LDLLDAAAPEADSLLDDAKAVKSQQTEKPTHSLLQVSRVRVFPFARSVRKLGRGRPMPSEGREKV